MQATRTCSIDGCDVRSVARSLCQAHYDAARRGGTLDQHARGPGHDPAAVSARFMAFVRVDESGCWLWQGHITKHGYGHFGMRRPTGGYGPRRAHRVAYELFVGPIPEGLALDHQCEIRHCVNPDHLKPSTWRANTLRNTSPAARLRRTRKLASSQTTTTTEEN